MIKNLPGKTLVNHKTHFNIQKVVRQQEAFTSYYIASWESFLINSWYFYEIATPIRAKTSVFYISRLFHNTLLSSIISMQVITIVTFRWPPLVHVQTTLTFNIQKCSQYIQCLRSDGNIIQMLLMTLLFFIRKKLNSF